MNRSVRRRMERDAKRNKPTVIVGEGMIARTLGEHVAVDDVKTFAKLAPKDPGKHRWVAMACFVLGDYSDSLLERTDVQKYLNARNMMDLGVVCWDCEGVWGVVKGLPCQAEADDR